VNTFTPPATSTVPPVLPPGTGGQTPLQYRLWRHYRSRPEGRNVYVLSDGTVTEDDPDSETVHWFGGHDSPADGTPYVVHVFYGGHDDYIIDDATATLLAAEGYTVGEDPGPPPDPPDPPPTSAPDAILLETGDPILLEDGQPILLET
jgi:hypothetical protein